MFARTIRQDRETALEFFKMNDFGRVVGLKELLRVQPNLLAAVDSAMLQVRGSQHADNRNMA